MTRKPSCLSSGDDPAYKARFGAVVRSYRRSLSLSQEELAWRAAMHQTYLSGVECGLRNISFSRLVQLVNALGVPLAEFFRTFDQYDSRTGKVPFATRAGLRGGSAAEPNAAGEILLVEDNATDAAMTAQAFQRAKFMNPVRIVRDAESALDQLLGAGHCSRPLPAPPRLILLDLNLPQMSGLEFLRLIKADERTRGIPVVVLTASRSDRLILECGRLGAQHYVVKPVAIGSLIDVTPKLNLYLTLGPPAGAS